MSAPDYFSLLSLPRDYAIDLKKLEQAYFTLQRQFHPDRAVGKPSMEKQQAMQASVRLNDAYQTLRDPLKRAEYLLSLSGIAIGTGVNTLKPSTLLLGEILELREELSDIQSQEQLALFAQKIDTEEKACTGAITKKFSTAALNDLQDAGQLTLRLGYLVKLREEARQKRLAFSHKAARQ